MKACGVLFAAPASRAIRRFSSSGSLRLVAAIDNTPEMCGVLRRSGAADTDRRLRFGLRLARRVQQLRDARDELPRSPLHSFCAASASWDA